MPYSISVDTGGTFTDVVVSDDTGNFTVGKALTTPRRVFEGMQRATASAGDVLGLSVTELLQQTNILVYGTTHSTNSLVENKVAKTALLVTEGFPDILVIKEGGKFDAHDFSVDYPEPYIPRRNTFEIAERITSEGEVLEPLDEVQARGVLLQLKEQSFDAVAVSFIWSIANPAHELALAALIEELLPGTPYTLSHQLVAIIREYRRTSATAIDASLKPLMQHHLMEMESDLREAGYAGEILVSTSIGGCMHVEELIERPIHTVQSGPAMSPVAGRTYSDQEGLGGDVIVCDTGGTTFDVGLVRAGNIKFTRETWLGGQWTGHILGISSIDVRSIGAGGGSIAWMDSGGLLRVGPHSAGADPGPACYGRGGDEPTVTDAALVLGYLDTENFLGGRMDLDRDASHRVIGRLAERLNRTPQEAAFAVNNLANELMIKAIQNITISEGLNPRECALVAGGGAAGLGIVHIARELGCKRVLLPKTAGALSACGMQFSDIVAEQTAACVTRTDDFDLEGANGLLEEIGKELEQFAATLTDKGFDQYRIEYLVEARYLFQVWELEVTLPFATFSGPDDIERLVQAFHRVHERVFAVRDDASPVECLNWKGRLSVGLGHGINGVVAQSGTTTAEPHGWREAFFGGTASLKTPVYLGAELPVGARLQGPLVIVEPTTTIVADESTTVHLTGANNYLLEI